MIHGAGVALAVLALAGTVHAQRIGGDTSGGGTGGGSTGSTGGGFVGSGGFGSGGTGGGGSGGGTGGGFVGTGGFGSGGTAGGGAAGGRAGGATGGRGATGGTATSNAGPFAKYMYSPTAVGYQQGTSGATAAIGNASNQVKPYPTTSTFGQPLYTGGTNTATVGRTGAGGQGQGQGQGTQNLYRGATSAGQRRAPAFTTEIRFERNPVRAAATMRPELQSVVASSSRLPSRDRISVTTEGDMVVLTGGVKDIREKRLAEMIVRMSPGVREIRNDLVTDEKTPE